MLRRETTKPVDKVARSYVGYFFRPDPVLSAKELPNIYLGNSITWAARTLSSAIRINRGDERHPGYAGLDFRKTAIDEMNKGYPGLYPVSAMSSRAVRQCLTSPDYKSRVLGYMEGAAAEYQNRFGTLPKSYLKAAPSIKKIISPIKIQSKEEFNLNLNPQGGSVPEVYEQWGILNKTSTIIRRKLKIIRKSPGSNSRVTLFWAPIAVVDSSNTLGKYVRSDVNPEGIDSICSEDAIKLYFLMYKSCGSKWTFRKDGSSSVPAWFRNFHLEMGYRIEVGHNPKTKNRYEYVKGLPDKDELPNTILEVLKLGINVSEFSDSPIDTSTDRLFLNKKPYYAEDVSGKLVYEYEDGSFTMR